MDKEALIQDVVESLARCQRPSIKAGWKKLGLSHAQLGMLYMLFYHKESSPKDLSEFLGVSKSAVTQLLDPLVDKGLVRRQNDPKDRRIVRLSLTPKGSQTLKKLSHYKYAGLRAALETLNGKELTELKRICKKMAAGI